MADGADGRGWWALGAIVVVAALVGIGVVTWSVVNDEDDVLLVGDSIMRQTGPALDEELAGCEVHNRGVNGSGLLNPQVYDWVERLPGVLAQTQPEATVVLFIGNYAPEDEWWIGPDGEPVPPNTPAFFAAWREQAERIVTQLEAAGTDIYWVLPPPVASAVGTETVEGLREVYRDLAADHPTVTLVDAAEVLADGSGAFVWSTPDGEGGTVPLRAGDGVHLDVEGAERLGRLIAEAVVAGSC